MEHFKQLARTKVKKSFLRTTLMNRIYQKNEIAKNLSFLSLLVAELSFIPSFSSKANKF